MAEAEASRVRNGYNSNGSGPRPAQTARECSYSEFLMMFPEEAVRLKSKSGGLPDMILGSVKKGIKSKTMLRVIAFTTEYVEDKTHAMLESSGRRKRKYDDLSQKQSKNNQNRRRNTGQALSCRQCVGPSGQGPIGYKINTAANNTTTPVTTTQNNYRNNHNNQQGNGCFEGGAQGTFKRNCPKLNNNDHGNQAGNNRAPAKVYAVGNAGVNPDNVVAVLYLYRPNNTRIMGYNVELADGRIMGSKYSIDGCTAVIDCAKKIVRIPSGSEILIVRGVTVVITTCGVLRRRPSLKKPSELAMGHYEFHVMPFVWTNAPAVFMDSWNREELYAKFSKCAFWIPKAVPRSRDANKGILVGLQQESNPLRDWASPKTPRKISLRFLGLAGGTEKWGTSAMDGTYASMARVVGEVYSHRSRDSSSGGENDCGKSFQLSKDASRCFALGKGMSRFGNEGNYIQFVGPVIREPLVRSLDGLLFDGQASGSMELPGGRQRFTWERPRSFPEEDYPHLFSRTGPSSNAAS
ncbi:hypothetical protein Tco_1337866 [Tanacetum coccineum]